SAGDATLVCVDSSACKGDYSEDDSGWCVKGCAAGTHDGGDGACVAPGACSAGFHDDGTGTCVASGCAAAVHACGDGSCGAGGTCAEGYVLDFNGDCARDPNACLDTPPVAHAGADAQANAGAPVLLDGSASTVSTAPATFHWELVSPAGANVTI